MKDQFDDPSHHERTLLPWSYISLRKYKNNNKIKSLPTHTRNTRSAYEHNLLSWWQRSCLCERQGLEWWQWQCNNHSLPRDTWPLSPSTWWPLGWTHSVMLSGHILHQLKSNSTDLYTFSLTQKEGMLTEIPQQICVCVYVCTHVHMCVCVRVCVCVN